MNQTVFGARVHGNEASDRGVVCGQREEQVDLWMVGERERWEGEGWEGG